MSIFDLFRRVPSISPEEVLDLIGKKQPREFCLVDVRRPQEYEEGHLPGAKLLPLSNLHGVTGKLDACKTIVVYCQTGSRSKAAARFLMSAGFKNVLNMRGGLINYRGAITGGRKN